MPKQMIIGRGIGLLAAIVLVSLLKSYGIHSDLLSFILGFSLSGAGILIGLKFTD